jgi:NAD(P)-dependent dehydrogenase (short-subunit alcohol dehydrogenase family)
MVVLITGASGGFGRVLGETLVKKGMTVYGTMRRPEEIGSECPFSMLPMEITDDASVEACIKEVVRVAGRIDVVVNCVNHMIIGSVEEETADEVRALYDTNVLGVLRVCQQIMRRQGSGTIVNMSSLGGLFAVPYMSAYTSAKSALEALSEAMHHELRSEPLDVVIMQPVAMAMDRPALGGHMATVANVGPDSRSHKMVERMARDSAASRLTPQAVAEKVYSVITSKKKPLRVPMDRARPMTLLKRLAPQALVDKVISALLPPD